MAAVLISLVSMTQAAAYRYTATNGTWSVTNNWEIYSGGSWGPATDLPGTGDKANYIIDGELRIEMLSPSIGILEAGVDGDTNVNAIVQMFNATTLSVTGIQVAKNAGKQGSIVLWNDSTLNLDGPAYFGKSGGNGGLVIGPNATLDGDRTSLPSGVNESFVVGYSAAASGTLDVRGTLKLNKNHLYVGYDGATGTVNQSDGWVKVKELRLDHTGGGGDATYNLTGGEFRISGSDTTGVKTPGPNAELHIAGGGTLLWWDDRTIGISNLVADGVVTWTNGQSMLTEDWELAWTNSAGNSVLYADTDGTVNPDWTTIWATPILRLEPGEDWFEWRMPWDSSVVDLSFLTEAPAGQHGFLKTQGRDLRFEDGTPLKIWGMNVIAIACMPEKADAPVLARNIRRRGFNLVRFHYFDSRWAGDSGERTLIDYTQGDSQHWNEDRLDRMFFFINELKKQGIYSMIDANSGREYLIADGLPTALPARARGHAIFVERLIILQQELIQRLFTQVNPYSGLAMKDDSAIAILNINNENDCLYGGVDWTLEPYATEMKQRFVTWAEDNGVANPGPIEEINFHPNERSEDATRFLMEIQKDYQERMAEFCRETVGIQALLCGANWNMGFFIPMTHGSMDLSDVHIYETTPNKEEGYIVNKRVAAEGELKFHSRNLLKVDDKPTISSEWDHRLPVETRAEYPCFLASQAAFGSWAGMIHFCALATLEKVDYAKGNNNSWSDPAIYGLFPHAALLYLRDARPAEKTVTMRMDADTIDVMEQTFPAQIKTPEVHNFLVSMKESPEGDFVVGPDEQPVDPSLDPIVSDTGEHRRSMKDEYIITDTAGTQVISANFTKTPTLATSNMTVTAATDFAVFALSSLEGPSIKASDHLLLTTIGRAAATGFSVMEDDGKIYYENEDLGAGPMLLEPVVGTVSLQLSTPGLSVTAIDAEGKAIKAVPSHAANGMLTFDVGQHNTMHYVIGRDRDRLFPTNSYNVLFIAIDDMRPLIDAYGATDPLQPITPQMDRLAASGVMFANAHCQQAVCNASRASLLTGLRPDTTMCWKLDTHFRTPLPDIITLPQHFGANGYRAHGIGKIYHSTNPTWQDDPLSWNEGWASSSTGYTWYETAKAVLEDAGTNKVSATDAGEFDRDSNPIEDADYNDGYAAEQGVAKIAEYASGYQTNGTPFFLAVGFQKPHMPFNAPKSYWDLYDPAQIDLSGYTGIRNMPVGSNKFTAPYGGEPEAFDDITGTSDNGMPNATEARHLIHGYLACVSFIDAQIGKLLDALEDPDGNPLTDDSVADNTIIVLWGDHGFHLGDHNGFWAKASNYEISTRVPLIVSMPGMDELGAAGSRSVGLVELVDIYPTLVDLCSLPAPAQPAGLQLQGTTFLPLLEDPAQPWKKAVFSQYQRNINNNEPGDTPVNNSGTGMGYSVRTERYRYTEWWVTESTDETDRHMIKAGITEPDLIELYDYVVDPGETTNLAYNTAYSNFVLELSALLNDSDGTSAGDGWALPETDAPSAYPVDYAVWQTNYLAPGRTLSELEANADPDGDGIVNRLEYKFGTHPLEFDVWPVESGFDAGLYVTYPDVESRAEVLLEAVAASNLVDGAWSSSGVTSTIVGQDGNAVIKTGSVPAADPIRFLMLEATEL